jgi:hypothetical protein
MGEALIHTAVFGVAVFWAGFLLAMGVHLGRIWAARLFGPLVTKTVHVYRPEGE